MLNDMPVGNPLYTDNAVELKDNFFGFIYATVTAPDLNIPKRYYKLKRFLIFRDT